MSVIETIIDRGGFVSKSELPAVVLADRLRPVLVRTTGGRFSCPAQDAVHFIRVVEAGGDYVRDVSIKR